MSNHFSYFLYNKKNDLNLKYCRLTFLKYNYGLINIGSFLLPLVKPLKLKLKGKTLRIQKRAKRMYLIKAGKTHLVRSFIKFNTKIKIKNKLKFFFFGYSISSTLNTALNFIY